MAAASGYLPGPRQGGSRGWRAGAPAQEELPAHLVKGRELVGARLIALIEEEERALARLLCPRTATLLEHLRQHAGGDGGAVRVRGRGGCSWMQLREVVADARVLRRSSGRGVGGGGEGGGGEGGGGAPWAGTRRQR